MFKKYMKRKADTAGAPADSQGQRTRCSAHVHTPTPRDAWTAPDLAGRGITPRIPSRAHPVSTPVSRTVITVAFTRSGRDDRLSRKQHERGAGKGPVRGPPPLRSLRSLYRAALPEDGGWSRTREICTERTRGEAEEKRGEVASTTARGRGEAAMYTAGNKEEWVSAKREGAVHHTARTPAIHACLGPACRTTPQTEKRAAQKELSESESERKGRKGMGCIRAGCWASWRLSGRPHHTRRARGATSRAELGTISPDRRFRRESPATAGGIAAARVEPADAHERQGFSIFLSFVLVKACVGGSRIWRGQGHQVGVVWPAAAACGFFRPVFLV
ncbi:hypothetical protein FB451DRAFT_1168224 [Mycena latifolia]|nr:hypothetical protein FB451DRAFT_1168224 [Mycena latifolia]